MSSLVVVTDNTMGLPGEEIDDGLALLYLLGCERAPRMEAVCCTHGNDATERTFEATRRLVSLVAPDMPVLRGADGPAVPSGDVASCLASCARRPGCTLLSLGATTDLAHAERLSPTTLGSFSRIVLMGGVLHTLALGGRVMDELNLSVDADATMAVLESAREDAVSPSRLLVADAQDCLPLIFGADEIVERLADIGPAGSRIVRDWCVPWFERARGEWSVDGFVGWDVLAAVAASEPELAELVPYRVALNRRFVGVGLLECATGDTPSVPLHLVRVRDASTLREHVLDAWERALRRVERG